jgi:rhomboid protease GluP
VSAGASGAIFGMYGVFLAMLTTNLIEKNQRKDLFTSIAIFVGFNLLYGTRGGIDNAAHIGGLVSGMLIGYAYIPGLKKPEAKKLQYITMAALTILVLATSFIVYKQLPNDILKFDNRMGEMVALEKKALDIYALPDQTPKEERLAAIKDKGIPAWKEGIALLEGNTKLDIPKTLQERNSTLKKYFELRLKSYELLYKKTAEDSDQYDGEMGSVNEQIEAIIKGLNQAQQGN